MVTIRSTGLEQEADIMDVKIADLDEFIARRTCYRCVFFLFR
jgi:hypothetical protein